MKATLDAAINDYRDFRRSEGLSPSTIANTDVVLRRLLKVIGSNLFVENITERHVTQYFTTCSRTQSPRTLALGHTVLSVFFGWCARTKRMPKTNDPMGGRRAPKWKRQERRRLSVGKFPALLDAAETPRDRMLMALGLYTLSRATELTGIKYGDVDLDGGFILINISKSRTFDRKPIGPELDAELRRWIITYQEECGPLDPDWYLVPARTRLTPTKGGPGFTPGSARYVPTLRYARPHRNVVLALEKVGFPCRDPKTGKTTSEGMHTLRRSGARALFDALRDGGYDGALELVQDWLNHANSTMTELYLGLTLRRVRRDEWGRSHYMYPQNAPQDNVVRMPAREVANA